MTVGLEWFWFWLWRVVSGLCLLITFLWRDYERFRACAQRSNLGGWWLMMDAHLADPPVLRLGQSFGSIILAITTVSRRMNWCQPLIYSTFCHMHWFRHSQLLLVMKVFPWGPEFTFSFVGYEAQSSPYVQASGFFFSFPFCFVTSYWVCPIFWKFTEQ